MSAIDTRIRERALNSPDTPALVIRSAADDAVWTWRELAAATGHRAAALSEVAGDAPVAATMATDNNAELVLELIAALRTDLPLGLHSRRAPAAEQDAFRSALRRRGIQTLAWTDGRWLSDHPPPRTATRIPSQSVLLATGGSSGMPKIVVDNRMRDVARRPRPARASTATNWRPRQHQLVLGPLHHTAALTFFVEGLTDGNLLLLQRDFDPGDTLRLVDEWRVRWLQATPYHLRRLAASLRRSPYDLGSVRGLLHLGAPCPDDLKRFWLRQLEPGYVFEMYGATEGVGFTLVDGREWLRRPGTVGTGFFTQIRIYDDAGRRLRPHVDGLVHLRSATAGRAVYLDARHQVTGTPDGFVGLGDRGHLDDERYLFLRPRQIAHIQVGDLTVYPAEVESVLTAHPAVADAAVLGVPDDRLGEKLVALIVPVTGPVDPLLLRRYARQALARHKVPRQFRFVSNLPYNDNGKLDRPRVADLCAAGEGHAAEVSP
ncbi:AMP-binding protein [Fodinicola acaciae]|uniref:AMP-binding protein n=1 Tax=Fodinicola acaciae TaxID=2681555 RepID=UPI0013D13ACE|nr:AMP-binding protein [Fodinicola acaciae]